MTRISSLNPEINKEFYLNEKTNEVSSSRNEKKFNNYNYLANEENSDKQQIRTYNKNKFNINRISEEPQVENFNLLDEKENLNYNLAHIIKQDKTLNTTFNLKKENNQEQVKSERINNINEQKVECPNGYQSYQKAVNVFKKYIQINKQINEKLLEDQKIPFSTNLMKPQIENKGEPQKMKFSDESYKEGIEKKIKHVQNSENINPLYKKQKSIKTKDFHNCGKVISPKRINDKLKFSENEINELISEYLDKNYEENKNIGDNNLNNKSLFRYMILNELKSDENLDIEIENKGEHDSIYTRNIENQSHIIAAHDKKFYKQHNRYDKIKDTIAIQNKNFENNSYGFNNIKIAKSDKVKEILKKIPNIISVFNNTKGKKIKTDENSELKEDKVISKFFNINNLSKLIDLSKINIKIPNNKNTNESGFSKKEILDSADNILNNHILNIKKVNNNTFSDRNFSSEKSRNTTNTFKENSINNTYNNNQINKFLPKSNETCPNNISTKESQENFNKKINYIYDLLQNYAKEKINDCLKNPEFNNKKEKQDDLLIHLIEKTADKNFFSELKNQRPEKKAEDSEENIEIIDEILKKEENISNKKKIEQELFNNKNANENNMLEAKQITSNMIYEKINPSQYEMINFINHEFENEKIPEIIEFAEELNHNETSFTKDLEEADFIKEASPQSHNEQKYLNKCINKIGTDSNNIEENQIHPLYLLKEGNKLKSNLKKDKSKNEENKYSIKEPKLQFAQILHSNSDKIISSKNFNTKDGNNMKNYFDRELEQMKNSKYSDEELEKENNDEVIESKNKTINCDIPYQTKDNQNKVRFSNKIVYIQYHEESNAEEIKICNQDGNAEKHKKLNMIQYLIKIKNNKFKPKKILHHYYNGIRDDRLPKKIVGYLKKSNSFNELDKEIGLQKINEILGQSAKENEQAQLQEKNRKRIVERNLNTIHEIAEARKKGSKIKKARSPTPRKIVENVICKKFKGDPNKFYSKNPPNSLLKSFDIPIENSTLKMSNSVGRYSERVSNKISNINKISCSQNTNQNQSKNRIFKSDKNQKPNEFNLESCISKKTKNDEDLDNYISNINFQDSLNDIEKDSTQVKETENFNEVLSHNSFMKNSKED